MLCSSTTRPRITFLRLNPSLVTTATWLPDGRHISYKHVSTYLDNRNEWCYCMALRAKIKAELLQSENKYLYYFQIFFQILYYHFFSTYTLPLKMLQFNELFWIENCEKLQKEEKKQKRNATMRWYGSDRSSTSLIVFCFCKSGSMLFVSNHPRTKWQVLSTVSQIPTGQTRPSKNELGHVKWTQLWPIIWLKNTNWICTKGHCIKTLVSRRYSENS